MKVRPPVSNGDKWVGCTGISPARWKGFEFVGVAVEVNAVLAPGLAHV